MIQRFFILILAIFSALIFSAAPAIAKAIAGSPQAITIHATVLPNRIIYADASGHLIRVASNTAENVPPHVMMGGLPATLTLGLGQQYQTLLKDNGGRLGIGYYTLPSYETIRLASAQAFSSSLSKLEFY